MSSLLGGSISRSESRSPLSPPRGVTGGKGLDWRLYELVSGLGDCRFEEFWLSDGSRGEEISYLQQKRQQYSNEWLQRGFLHARLTRSVPRSDPPKGAEWRRF